jgi:uncharacterized protein (DUF885 family)
MRILPAAVLTTALFIAACGNEQPASEPQAEVADPTETLHTLFDEFFERGLELNPMRATSIGDYRFNDKFANSIGPEHREAKRIMDEEFLARLLEIDRAQLSRQDQLSYDMFKLNREQSLEGDRFPGHLQPINQFYSPLNSFVQLGSGTSVHPFKTVKHYDDWLSRIDGFVVYADQALANMKEGMRQGVIQPRILMAKSLPQIQSQFVDSAEESGFWAPIENMPEEFSAADRERLTAAFKEAIETKVIPVYQRMANFVGDEYMSTARDTVGLYALPDGPEWYAYNVRRITTTELTPDEIHQIGLNEVARIHAEMQGVMEQVGFEGDLKEFFDFMNNDDQFYFDEGDQLIEGYRDMSDHVSELAKALFNVFPKTGFEVRRVEAFREASASATRTPMTSRHGRSGAWNPCSCTKPFLVITSSVLCRSRTKNCRASGASAVTHRSPRGGVFMPNHSVRKSVSTRIPTSILVRSTPNSGVRFVLSSIPACMPRSGLARTSSITCTPIHR